MKIRIATVNATGMKYIVQQLSFGTNPKAHCWGEVVSFKNCATKHEESKTFLLSAVTVVEIERTGLLIEELFGQTLKGRIAADHILTRNRTGTKITDHGAREARQA